VVAELGSAGLTTKEHKVCFYDFIQFEGKIATKTWITQENAAMIE